MKRTELRRLTPLQPGTPLVRRAALRPRSKKRTDLYRTVRVPLVKRLLLAIPVCERCQSAPSEDIHERLSRARGGSITDLANLVAVCRPCHSWITTHPKDAEAEGWALSRRTGAAA
jgi:hypothetical protein